MQQTESIVSQLYLRKIALLILVTAVDKIKKKKK